MLATALSIAVPLLAAQDPETQKPPRTGTWRAVLDSQGGPLPFRMELRGHGRRAMMGQPPVLGAPGWHGYQEFTAAIFNGDEEIEVPDVEWADGVLAIRFEPYDSVITARPSFSGTELTGEWTKTSGSRVSRMRFRATHGIHERFGSPGWSGQLRTSAEGRWAVQFDTNAQPAVGNFERRDDGAITGTFLTTTGDYRYLEGALTGDLLRLSCFDGSHAFLFQARVDSETMKGQFWSSGGAPTAWTAKRDPDASLPEAFDLTKWNEGVNLAELSYPDPDGRLRSLEDPEFKRKARLLVVFGTWCPNCNDEAPYLVELDERYRERGLSILGLAFEHSGEHERDAARVRSFMKRHGVRYPILIAGTSSKSRASEAFPALDRVRSYPTTIFMDGAGKVRAVHQGYTGPATGEVHLEMRRRFEELIEELLAEGR